MAAVPEAQELSLAEYAATIAEQLDFAVVTVDVGRPGGQFDRNPGVLLIDPWFAANEHGLRRLRKYVNELPPWVLAMPVIDAEADERTMSLAREVRAILEKSLMPSTEVAKRGVEGVSSLADFVAVMPFLIAEAERRYLGSGPIERSTALRGSRPRIVADGWQAGSARKNESGQEEPR